MPDWITPEALNSFTVVGLCVLFAIGLGVGLIYTRGQYRAVERRAERWEGIALEQLEVGRSAVHAAEVTTAIVSRLPDPQREEGTP